MNEHVTPPKYVILKGMPVPRNGKEKDPESLRGKLRGMDVGDCLVAAGINPKTASASVRLQCKESKDGRKYTTRIIDRVVHVWRLK